MVHLELDWVFYLMNYRKNLKLARSFSGSRFIFAMSSPSELTNEEILARRQRSETPIKFLIPLIYAPILPLIRIAFRRNPVVRDRLFTAVLAGGFIHGGYLVTDLYDVESK